MIRIVEAQQAAGYDFIKVYHGTAERPWGPGVFDTLIATAKRVGLPVAGHVPTMDSAGVAYALAVPYRSMEHFHGYLQYLGVRLEANDARLAGEAHVRWAAAEAKRARVWNTPTLTFNLGLQILPYRRYIKLFGKLVVALQDAGAGLLLGTDNNQCDGPLVSANADKVWQSGFAVRYELQTLVDLGLTPYQALATGTRNVAAFLGTLDSAGTVAVGKRADLVLVTGNPLEDFAVLARPAGVMIGGRWLSRQALDAGMDARGIDRKKGTICRR